QSLSLERQLRARPLVPGAGVVPRVVAEPRQHLYGERRARAAVAVADDLSARLDAHAFAQFLLAQLHQLLHVEVDRAGDVALPRIAGAAEGSVVLLGPADVEHAELAEAQRELVELDVHQASPRTSSSSAAIAGRSPSCSSQR